MPESEQQQSPAQPSLCASGCGFFANVALGGSLCSKCYRDQETARQKAESAALGVGNAATTAVASSSPLVASPPTAVEPPASDISQPMAIPGSSSAQVPELVAAPAVGSAGSTPPAGAAAPCRCNIDTCKKKLGLTGFKCRCGLTFCGAHRAPESHACSFDFKALGRERIASENPLVAAQKVTRL